MLNLYELAPKVPRSDIACGLKPEQLSIHTTLLNQFLVTP